MKFSRKIFLINPDFQLKLMAWMVGMSLAPISVFFAAHYYFFWNLKKLGEDIQLEPDHVYFRFLDGQSHKMILIFLICSVLTIIIVAVLGLLLSHKVAGPVHRLKMHLTQLGDGKVLKKLSFRKDDYFQELPQVINEFLENQEKKNQK